jgi:hypothetical protein
MSRMRRELNRDHLGLLEDWQGNNIALACPLCLNVFTVSGIIHRNGRDCPYSGRSKAFVSQDGKTASVESSEPSVLLWSSE